MSKEINHTKVLFWISIPAFAIMIVMLAMQWFISSKNLLEMKDQNRKNFEKISVQKNYGPFEINYTTLNKRQVIIDPKELEKINNHIKVLTEEVYKESNRAESIIDKDLDRLNLYMAVGIGFMTLLGVFVPILINVLSVQDLRDKQKEISENFNVFKEQQPNILKAIEDSKTAVSNANSALDKSRTLDGLAEKINAIELIAKRAIPDICNLVLQNAIVRFFNISPIVLTNTIRTQNYDDFIQLLQAINNAFTGCKNDQDHKITGNINFIYTIDNFILFLETEKFQFHLVFNTRQEIEEFQKLIEFLQNLKNSTDENKVQNYDALTTQIEIIIKLFQDKNAKNQSAT